MAIRLLLAAFFGAAVGYEREYVGKAAGFRTYALVSMGACLFTILSIFGLSAISTSVPQDLPAMFRYNYDPTRIISQIVVGIGFLGAGLIVFRGFRIEGLTTAAGLWVAAAIGTAVGFGFIAIAALATVLELTIFYILKRFEPHEHPSDADER